MHMQQVAGRTQRFRLELHRPALVSEASAGLGFRGSGFRV